MFGVDSKRFVSVGRDRAAKLVDAEKGQFLENVNQLRGELSAIARHPKKDIIVIGGEDRIPYLYMMDRPRNMKVGEEATLIRKLEVQEGPIFALDWSPDGKRIAVAGAGPKVNLYDAESGAKLAACGGHSAGIYAVAFSPDGARLATGGFDGQVRFYNSSDCTLQKAMVPVPVTAAGGRGRRRAMKLLLVAFVTAGVCAAQPLITDLQPRGAQKGRPFTLTLIGRDLGEGAESNRRCPPPSRRSGRKRASMGASFLVEPTGDPAVGVYPIRVDYSLRNLERPTLLDRLVPRVHRGRIASRRSPQHQRHHRERAAAARRVR